MNKPFKAPVEWLFNRHSDGEMYSRAIIQYAILDDSYIILYEIPDQTYGISVEYKSDDEWIQMQEVKTNNKQLLEKQYSVDWTNGFILFNGKDSIKKTTELKIKYYGRGFWLIDGNRIMTKIERNIDGTVNYESLSDALSGVLCYKYCGEYDKTNSNYQIGNQVLYKGSVYILTKKDYDFTAGIEPSDSNNGYWQRMTVGNNPMGEWKSDCKYIVGDMVSCSTSANLSERNIYMCIKDCINVNVSNISYWKMIFDLSTKADAVTIGNLLDLKTNKKTDIVTAINEEHSERKTADTKLQSNITQEATYRKKADEKLQSNIDIEAETRKTSDEKLQNNITEEITYRFNADDALRNNLDAITRANYWQRYICEKYGSIEIGFLTEFELIDQDFNDVIKLVEDSREYKLTCFPCKFTYNGKGFTVSSAKSIQGEGEGDKPFGVASLILNQIDMTATWDINQFSTYDQVRELMSIEPVIFGNKIRFAYTDKSHDIESDYPGEDYGVYMKLDSMGAYFNGEKLAKDKDLLKLNNEIDNFHKINCKSAKKTTTNSNLDINSDGDWHQGFNIPTIELQSKHYNSITLPSISLELSDSYASGTNIDCYIKYKINDTKISTEAITRIHSDVKEEYCKVDLKTESIIEVMLYIADIRVTRQDTGLAGSGEYEYRGYATPSAVSEKIDIKQSVDLTDIKKDIGQLSNLKTKEKSNIVGSINEVNTRVNEGFAKVDEETEKNIDLINQKIDCYHKIKCKSAEKVTTDSDLNIYPYGNWAQVFNIPDIEIQSKYHKSLTLPNSSIEFTGIYDAGTNVDCYVKYIINGTEISVETITQRHSDIKEEYCKLELETGIITEVMLCVGNVSMNKEPDYRPDGTIVYVYSGEAIPLNINSSIHMQQSVDLTDIKNNIGQLSNLKTSTKDNIVGAINELKLLIENSGGGESTLENRVSIVELLLANLAPPEGMSLAYVNAENINEVETSSIIEDIQFTSSSGTLEERISAIELSISKLVAPSGMSATYLIMTKINLRFKIHNSKEKLKMALTTRVLQIKDDAGVVKKVVIAPLATDVKISEDSDARSILQYVQDVVTSGSEVQIEELKEYVDTAIGNVIDGAPAELDTLKEISVALKDGGDATAAIVSTLATKADKEPGKGLYPDIDKTKLAGIATGAQKNAVTKVAGRTGAIVLTKGDVGLTNVDNTADLAKPVSTATQTALDKKVNSVSGSGLYPDADKTKLAGVAENANNYTHPSTHTASMITESTTKRFVSDTEKSTWNDKTKVIVASTMPEDAPKLYN